MSALARAAAFVVIVVGLSGALFFVARRDQSPPRSVVPEASPRLEQARVGRRTAPPEPIETTAVEPAIAPAPSAAPVAIDNQSEDALAAAIHALEDSNPMRALELARRGQEQWPSGARAPEFAAAEVKCLYRLGRASEGRGAAEAMVNKYPTSPWALEVEKQTGAHPYVNH